MQDPLSLNSLFQHEDVVIIEGFRNTFSVQYFRRREHERLVVHLQYDLIIGPFFPKFCSWFFEEEEAIIEILIGKKLYEKVYVHEPLVIVRNGRLITGQNPESATNVSEKVVEILKG